MPSKKIMLDEDEITKQWYCILPSVPKALPPTINPETRALALSNEESIYHGS